MLLINRYQTGIIRLAKIVIFTYPFAFSYDNYSFLGFNRIKKSVFTLSTPIFLHIPTLPFLFMHPYKKQPRPFGRSCYSLYILLYFHASFLRDSTHAQNISPLTSYFCHLYVLINSLILFHCCKQLCKHPYSLRL